jgi:GT2 family glycosyltransferase
MQRGCHDRRVPDLSICVPVYRRHAAPNLGTLAAALPAALDGASAELVVALNGIDAESAGVPPGAVTVELDVNRGVAPGWNAAAAAARAEVLCFCNDDLVPSPSSISLLERALREHHDAGVVGPLGARWDISAGRHLDFVSLDGLSSGDVTPCEAVAGFMFACRRDTWEDVGGFDERYAPFSWEEIDFCTAVRSRGLRCYAVAGVEHEHEFGVSAHRAPWRRIRWDGRSESIWRIHRRNKRLFLRKWSQAAVPEP